MDKVKLEFLRGTLDVLILEALVWAPLHRKARFYRLTTDGRRQFRQEVKTWDAYATAVARVLGATEPPLPERMA